MRRRQHNHPRFAQDEERIDCRSEKEAERKPGDDILKSANQRQRHRGHADRVEDEIGGAEPSREPWHEGRRNDQANRRHRRRKADGRRRNAILRQDKAEQRIGKSLRDSENRDGRDDSDQQRPVGSLRDRTIHALPMLLREFHSRASPPFFAPS